MKTLEATQTVENIDEDTKYFENVDALADMSREPSYKLLDDVWAWFKRFIKTQDVKDLDVLALWTVHTFLLKALPVSPRLILDSIVAGSGKTTVLEHIEQLGYQCTLASAFGSAAIIPRMIDAAGDNSMSILIDEADRTLSPAKEGYADLIACINSGYKHGASKPTLVPTKGGGWEAKDMPTYAAIAMAGNSPRLADDTRSRSIPIFLLPDYNGETDETDWVSNETLTNEASDLHERIATWARLHAPLIQSARPQLPPRCKNRNKERWISFMKIAQVAGGAWPERVETLINADLDRIEAERADGLNGMPPKVRLIQDLMNIFGSRDFMPTDTLTTALSEYAPEQWGAQSDYGKPITRQRLAKMLSPMGIHSIQPYTDGHKQPRGYMRKDLQRIAEQLHLSPQQ